MLCLFTEIGLAPVKELSATWMRLSDACLRLVVRLADQKRQQFFFQIKEGTGLCLLVFFFIFFFQRLGPCAVFFSTFSTSNLSEEDDLLAISSHYFVMEPKRPDMYLRDLVSRPAVG